MLCIAFGVYLTEETMTNHRSAEDPEILFVIDAPHFYCGVIVRNGRVIQTAPIVHYLKGWDRDRVQHYAQRRGWRVEVVPFTGGTYDTLSTRRAP